MLFVAITQRRRNNSEATAISPLMILCADGARHTLCLEHDIHVLLLPLGPTVTQADADACLGNRSAGHRGRSADYQDLRDHECARTDQIEVHWLQSALVVYSVFRIVSPSSVVIRLSKPDSVKHTMP